MALILETDFLNNPVFDIARSKQSSKELPALIDDIEKDYLQKLLGCELYNLFQADLTAGSPTEAQVPENSPYVEIFEPFCSDDYSCGILESKGMKDMLMGFVYFAWHSYNLNKSTAAGMGRLDMENAANLDGDSFGIYTKQNRGIISYDAIQQYICENESDYPTFNGEQKQYSGLI